MEASAWLGQVDENFQPLKIMVPFTQKGVCTVKSIVPEGDYKIEDVCRGKENGTEIYGLEDRLPRQGGLIQSYNEKIGRASCRERV